jgi:hypothetical protein
MKEFEVSYRLSNVQGARRDTNQAVLRVLPFTPTPVNGKTYWVTKADVSVKTALGNRRKAVGLIFDRENAREYALGIEDFNRFMETGDLSLLPKELTRSPRVRTLQLTELRLPIGKSPVAYPH